MQTGYTALANNKSDTNISRQNQLVFELYISGKRKWQHLLLIQDSDVKVTKDNFILPLLDFANNSFSIQFEN